MSTNVTRLPLNHIDPLGAAILIGSDNPRTVAGGVNAAIGSLYIHEITGAISRKAGAAATAWVSLDNYGWFSVADYGAVGGGVDDSVAFANTLAAIPASGGVFHIPPGPWYLGVLTNTNLAGLLFAGRSNIVIVASGAIISVTDSITSGAQQAIFKFVDCNEISSVGRLQFQGTQTQHQFGPAGILIVADAANTSGYRFDYVKATQCRATIEVVSSSTNATAGNPIRVRELLYGVVKAIDCFYGAMFIENGDHAVVQLLYTDNVVRSLYIEGVENVDVNVESNNHQSATADVLIQTAYSDTRNIKVRYVPRANVSAEFLVRIAHISTAPAASPIGGPSAGKIIENIEIFFDDGYAIGGNWGVTIREEGTNGISTTTSPHIVDNIKISGKFTRYNAPDTIISCPTAFARPGRLYVDPSFTAVEGLLWTNILANFLLYVGPKKWARSLKGLDLNANPLDFDLSRVVTPSSGAMHLIVKTKIHITPDYTGSVGAATQKDQYWEDVHVLFINGLGTAVDLGTTSNLKSLAYGTGYAPTVAFTAIGSSLRATFSAANGGGAANNRCVGSIEVI